jgi:hypothetical protein
MAKAKRPGEVPTIALQPKVTIHELKPQPTIKAAVSAASSHVNAVNAQSKGKGQGQGQAEGK